MIPDEPMPSWRDDIDSLAFHPRGHEGMCVVHRLAFRTLLGIDPAPQDCIDCFHAQRSAFVAAAAEKIARSGLPREANFHLNSRDIGRAASPAQ